MSTVAAPTNVEVVGQYFARLDQGRDDLIALFSEQCEFYFPKFGVAIGHSAVADFLGGIITTVASAIHHIDSTQYIVAGDRVVVEGLTTGSMKSGETWEGGKTPGGRFCNVFEIREGLIHRLFIYLDPDYVGADTERFLWNDRRQSMW
jgi:ketosteroid isomerase-like protein